MYQILNQHQHYHYYDFSSLNSNPLFEPSPDKRQKYYSHKKDKCTQKNSSSINDSSSMIAFSNLDIVRVT